MGAVRRIRRTTITGVLLLAGVAAVVSFRHMHELCLRHGEDQLAAVLIPLAVDGAIVVASMSILLANRYGSRGSALAWIMLMIGSLASLGANIAIAEPSLISADEKTSIQARCRCNPTLPPGPARAMRVNHDYDYDRGGALAYLAASTRCRCS